MTLTDKGAAATSDALLPDAMSGLQRNVADTLRVVWKELQEKGVVDQSWTLEEETMERVTSYSLDISIAAASFAIEVSSSSSFLPLSLSCSFSCFFFNTLFSLAPCLLLLSLCMPSHSPNRLTGLHISPEEAKYR